MEGRFSVADAHVDKTEYDANFALVKKFEDEAKAAGTLDKDAELLWRLARAYVLKSENASDKTEQEQLAREALNYARRSLQAEDTPLGHKWVAIGLGRIGDFLPTKEKIESAFEIKEHALKAPQTDPTVQHILGRWCFSIASIGFIERKLASVIFATPPESSFEEALPYFLKHEELLKGNGMLRNKIYIGDTLLKLGKKEEAAEWYEKATKFNAIAESDKQLLEEAKKKLASTKSSSWW